MPETARRGEGFCLTSDITLNEASYQYQDASRERGFIVTRTVGAVDQSGNCYENLETSQTTDPGSLSRVTLWTAVGTKGYPFQGSFDGKDHTIRGLCVLEMRVIRGCLAVLVLTEVFAI